MSKDIYIFGASGHAKVVADSIILQKKFNLKGFVASETKEKTFFEFPIFKENEVIHKIENVVVAIGDNQVRKKVIEKILNTNPKVQFPNVIHPSAVVAKSVQLGLGNMLMAGAVIQPDTVLGDHNIINTCASIDHDCKIKNYCMIAPTVCFGGSVSVSEMTFIALGTFVLPGIKIGKNSFIGAGSLVTTDIPSNVLAYGHPCKVIENRKSDDNFISV